MVERAHDCVAHCGPVVVEGVAGWWALRLLMVRHRPHKTLSKLDCGQQGICRDTFYIRGSVRTAFWVTLLSVRVLVELRVSRDTDELAFGRLVISLIRFIAASLEEEEADGLLCEEVRPF
jgi:hypothetical protein